MQRSICFVGHLMLPLLLRSEHPVVGGAEVQSLHLAEELHRRGWQLRFLVCSLDPGTAETLQTPLGPARVLYPRSLDKSITDKLREKRATFAAIRQEESDLVFQRAVWDADVAALAARWRRRPYVYSLASDRDAMRLPFASRRRNVLRLASTIVAQSESQRAWIERYGRRARVIASGFPVPEWRTEPRREVLWAGTLRSLKRPDLFLDLAAALPEHHFVLCGGPGEDPKLAARIADRAAHLPNLRFEGFVPYARMQERFASARVLVNTSTYEGFPNTFALAWLHGAVVLSLGVDPDGALSQRGLGVVARDPADLLAHLRRLLESEAVSYDFAMRARQYAETSHDIRRVASEYEEQFEAVCRGRI
jgi:glycosyltransferase involved in cell wall biosynthesis